MRTCEKCERNRTIRAFAKKGRGRTHVCTDCTKGKKPVTDLVRVNSALSRAGEDKATLAPFVEKIAQVMRNEEIARVLVDVTKGTYEVIWFRRETIPLPVAA
jgi:protein-arginine kinase activator protein McsA